jgi:hypothetical protein
VTTHSSVKAGLDENQIYIHHSSTECQTELQHTTVNDALKMWQSSNICKHTNQSKLHV